MVVALQIKFCLLVGMAAVFIADRSVYAEGEAVQETEAVAAQPSLLEQAASAELEKIDDQELVDMAAEVRSALVKTRVDAQNFRYQFEVENIEARQLIAEMTELQKQVVEKSRKLEVLLSEQEAYSVLSSRESEMVGLLTKITAERELRNVKNGQVDE